MAHDPHGYLSSPNASPTIDRTVLSDIADAYSGFVEQTLHHAARVFLQTVQHPSSAADVGRLMGWLCRALFADGLSGEALMSELLGDYPSQRDKMKLLLQRLHDDATALRQRVASESISHHWDFAFTSGSRLDERRQQPWGRSDPRHPTQCVVAPALHLDGRIFQKQRVLTGAGSPAA